MQNNQETAARSDENSWGVFGPKGDNADVKLFGPVTKERAQQRLQELGSPDTHYVGTLPDQKEIDQSNSPSWSDPSTAYPYGRDTESWRQASKDTSMSKMREAELLQAMASAPDHATQTKIAAELETLRANRIMEHRRADSFISEQAPQSRWDHNPNPASVRTSMASDWLMQVEAPEHTAMQRDQQMVAEASLWFTSTSKDVREDREEFQIQALGMSAHLASQFGEDDAPLAQRTFLDHAGHLVGYKVAADEMTMDTNTETQATDPVETEPMSDINAPADTGPSEVDHSTPSGDASLSEGDQPEGDHTGDVPPVPQSATVNNAGDPGDTFPAMDNKPFTTNTLSRKKSAKVNGYGLDTDTLKPGDTVRLEDAKPVTYHGKDYHGNHVDPSSSAVFIEHEDGVPSLVSLDSLAPHPGGKAGSKRQALQQKLAKSEKCLACNEAIHKDTNGKWTHSTYLHHKGHQRNHVPTPASSKAKQKYTSGSLVQAGTVSQDDDAQTLKNTEAPSHRYQVHMKHPSGTEYKETVAATGPDAAIASVRGKFNEGSGAEYADWSAKHLAKTAVGDDWEQRGPGGAGYISHTKTFPNGWKASVHGRPGESHNGYLSLPSGEMVAMTNSPDADKGKAEIEEWHHRATTNPGRWGLPNHNVAAVTAAAPEPDGLNSGVDFKPAADPSDGLSLGPGNEGEWPDPADGNPQELTNPTVASLYDASTDRRIATASVDHELAASASRSGTIFVDGDLTVIAAEIAGESYVKEPVRRVYLGTETQ